MEPKDFIIKRFELNFPEFVKLVEEWTEISIQRNWENVKIFLNTKNCPDVPASGWDETTQSDKRYAYFIGVIEVIVEYLQAKGYPAVSYTKAIISINEEKTETRDKFQASGYCITAHTKLH